MYQPDHIVAGMAAQASEDRSPIRRDGAPDEPPVVLEAGLIVLGAYNLFLAVFMTVAPRAFFTSIGPFEELNRHYIRDIATYSASMGVGALVAIRRPSWRTPVLAISTIQFGLHTVNHLLDASSAHPQWTGWFDFASLLAGTLLLAWMWRSAARAETRASGGPRSGRPRGADGAPGASPARTSVSTPRTGRSTA